MTRTSLALKASGAFLALVLIWGSAYFFTAASLRDFQPHEIVLLRVGFGAIVLVPLVIFRRERWPNSPRMWMHIAVVAFFGNVVTYLAFSIGQESVTSITAGIYSASVPALAVAFAKLISPKERLGWWTAFGLFVSTLGVLLLIGQPEDASVSTLSGHIACLIGAASFAFAIPYTKSYLSNAGSSPLMLAACQLAAGAVLAAFACLFFPTEFAAARSSSWVAAAWLGVVGTGGSFWLYMRLVGSIGVARTASAEYLVPVIATLLGTLFLNEPLHAVQVLATIVILLGVYLIQRR